MSSEISLKEKASFGIGAVGKDMGYWIMAGYLMVFFTDTVQLSPAYIGFLFLFARIWDAFNDPIMGWIVDNTKSRWGKFRPWILIGTLLNSAIVLLLFWDPTDTFGPIGVMVWCGVFYILWGMSYTVMDIPFWSMIPAFSSDSKVRDLMSVIPRTGAMIGGQLTLIFGLPIIAFLGRGLGGTESDGFFRFTMLVVVIFIICEIICVRNVREHVQTPLRQKISIKDVLKLLGRNDQLVVIIILTIIQQIAQNLVNGTIIYYFRYAIAHEEYYSLFMAAGAITQFVAFLIFPGLVQKTSRRFVYILSAALMVAGYLLMFFLGSKSDSSLVIAAGSYCIASCGVALSLVSTTVMLADTVDYGEYKLGTRSESIVFSMQTMTVKFGNALAGFMSSLTLAIVGYIPNVPQSESTLFGLRFVMFIASSILIGVMILIYLRRYKLNGDFYKNMLSALEVSREKTMREREGKFFVRYSLDPKRIFVKTSAQNKTEIINKLVDALKDNEAIGDLEKIRAAIFAREAQASTGIADGIAIPHAKSSEVSKCVMAVAVLDKAIDFDAPDKKPCDLIFLLVSPDDGNSHLEMIGRLGLILNDKETQQNLRAANDGYALLEIMQKQEKELLKN